MFIREVTLQNILSFGSSTTLQMKPLNVLVGPNGCGKSNFIEAMALLRAAPTDIRVPIQEGGGVGDWLWKGRPRRSSARVEVVVANPGGKQPLRYGLEFGARSGRFQLLRETLEDERPYPNMHRPYTYFSARGGRGTLDYRDADDVRRSHALRPEDIDPNQSVLAQRKDPNRYPEITYMGRQFAEMRLYRAWTLGRATPPRLPQRPDLPNDFLLEDASNLGLVLNRLTLDYATKQTILRALQELYDGISDFHVHIRYGAVQLFLQEGNITVPATRLSDGTLRYLSLLAILCDPAPPPLVCLEEPELGLHSDSLPVLARLLRSASRRCQLVVATHSDALVEALAEVPHFVVACDKADGQTTFKRLEKEEAANLDQLDDRADGRHVRRVEQPDG